jgi:transcriptional regulator with XRE-family HTH domain
MERARDRLRAWRESKDLTQTDAAKLLGIWQGTWSAWEKGWKRPSIEMLVRIEALTKGSRHRVRVEDWVETKPERDERIAKRAG